MPKLILWLSDLLRGQPYGNTMLTLLLVALGYAVYGGIPWVMQRIDGQIETIGDHVDKIEERHASIEAKRDDTLKEVVAEFRAEQKETRLERRSDREELRSWLKSINDRIDGRRPNGTGTAAAGTPNDGGGNE